MVGKDDVEQTTISTYIVLFVSGFMAIALCDWENATTLTTTTTTTTLSTAGRSNNNNNNNNNNDLEDDETGALSGRLEELREEKRLLEKEIEREDYWKKR